ncbi:MAG: hypothetical protein ACRC7O_05050 [Fimbriiglobus sp.]
MTDDADDFDADDFDDEPRRPAADGSGFAVASLVLGLVGLVLWCCPPVGVMTGLAGLILGFVGLSSRSRGSATAGMVLSLAGLILAVALGVIAGVMVVQEQELQSDPSGNNPPFFDGID